jgi:hypothetical protein
MVYGSTPLLTVSNYISDLTALAGVVALFFYIRRRRRTRHQPDDEPVIVQRPVAATVSSGSWRDSDANRDSSFGRGRRDDGAR